MNHSRRLFSTLLLGATLVHCSAGSDASSGGGDTGGALASGGGGNGGVPSSGGEGGGGGEPIFTTSNGGAGEGGTGGGEIIECVSKTVVGEEVGLAMVILQDRSGSMTTAKWTAAVDGIKAFADDADAAGIFAGLAYFPPTLGSECVPATYQNLPVDIDVLPGNAGPIKQSLLQTDPSGGTPMQPALQGAVDAMKAYLLANPGKEGVVVLVTDGDPSGCSSSVSNVSSTAAAALAGTPSIRTFVVGMDGATFGNLDTIATAGGTSTSFNVGSGSADFLAALAAVRSQALACEYILPIPDPSEGTLDPDSVGVNFIPGLNEDPIGIPRVDEEDDCGELSGGFYYDDNSNPTRIILCEASCETVQTGTENAKIDVILGCIEPPPE